ncbi:lysophospholipase-like protein 1 isoform X1 [Artibeus jamaicensis]|uniref:lysophospholipase-like protein 1 isoform X1 n=1 Tax=Artibeus jamaicensis TaxID=9417 RepID=UPI00235ABC82|nr:lysophospholipase-like protein 1 isoform X1 [Artibeus jamaicensis]
MAAASALVPLQRCVVSPAGRHSASLIFLHGSGDSGQGLRRWIKQVLSQDLTFQHIKIIYPTAPPRPYTAMKGRLSSVWFDRFRIAIDCPEHLESIDAMCQLLTDVIDDEVRSGIQKDRILVGGFSMGGCMAMHLAYRKHQDVAGVFALSSFLNKVSAVYQALQTWQGKLPDLLQCHGTEDDLVLPSWGAETSVTLRSMGVRVNYHSFPGLSHELSARELETLRSWVLTKLPGEMEGAPQ